MPKTLTTGMQQLGILPIVVAHVLNHVSVTKASVISKHYGFYDYAAEKRDALKQVGRND